MGGLCWLVVACGERPVSTSAVPSSAPVTANGTESPEAETGHPVPAQVADLHRSFFEPSAKPVPGGKVQCLITVFDGELSHDQFYAVALFADGSVATWTQSLAKGRVGIFLAKLSPEENTRALAWLEDIAPHRSGSRDRFAPSTTVMGISTRAGETAYFATDETPEPLDQLAGLLKQRLEATNAR